MGEHKYFEACLALKAAEEGLQLDSVMLSEAPVAITAAEPRQ